MEAHQSRVLSERDELTERINNLDPFLDSGVFKTLDDAEQERLTRQRALMGSYLNVLNERIAAFPK